VNKVSRLSVKRIEDAFTKIDPVFLNTPQYINESLSRLLGVNLILKIETVNPIRSFKGRGSDWLVSSVDPKTTLICASAGNFGQAMAYSCRKRNCKLIVYARETANPFKVARMRSFGATVILHGNDFDAAKLEAKRVAREEGIRCIEDSQDIETVEGAGTIGLELLKFPQKIDTLLLPLGNGAMFNGISCIFKANSLQTKIIAVQAAGASAMVDSWKSGKIVTHKTTHTIADGIAVRIPVPQALEDMKGLIDDAFLVTEESIHSAMKLLHVHAGVIVEPSGAVGVAAILEHGEKLKGKTVATIICGSNLTEEQIGLWL